MKASWFLTGLVGLAWASPVAAQPTARMALTWSAPPGCPTTESVQARVDALLGGVASASSVADVRASGQVERVENGFRLLLSMGVGNAPSSRVIEARTCDELAGAAAIAIALLARSTVADASPEAEAAAGSSAAGPAPSSAEAPPKADAPAKHEEASHTREAPAEPASDRVRFVIDAPIGVVGWGSLPGLGLGLGAALGIRWKALRVVAGAEAWLPRTDEVSGFATRFTLQSARLEVCLGQSTHGLEVAPCLGAAAEREVGKGIASDVFSASSRTVLWGSGLAGLFVSLPLPGLRRLRFFGEAAVLVSPLRPRFVINQLGPVHEPALAAPKLDCGFEWIL
ncbi:MAG TPA: hypothetical protein VHB79_16990 [Polyangiaceae bacterium]|nr:hypothetical protein [Polyangiaceae bacterium]